MSSVVKGKVALITGGSGGIGFAFAQQLLEHGAKGVELVDINQSTLQCAKEELAKEFGSSKVDIIKADVSDKDQFERAFKKTIQTFEQLDIVINNAGIADDSNYEKEIQINCNGVVHGTLLALNKYLPKFKSGDAGYIVNISSMCAVLDPSRGLPIYTGTKYFVVGFGRALGAEVHYKRTKVKILTICPGLTNTNILKIATCLGQEYMDIFLEDKEGFQEQSPQHLGRELINILDKAASGTVWVVDSREPAREIVN